MRIQNDVYLSCSSLLNTVLKQHVVSGGIHDLAYIQMMDFFCIVFPNC